MLYHVSKIFFESIDGFVSENEINKIKKDTRGGNKT